VNLKLTVKPERRDEFIMLIKDNQEQTLTSESAALQYVVGEDTTTPNTFYIHEEFTGEQGFLDHRNTPHAANWVAFRNSKPFTEDGEPEFNFFEGFHEAVAVPVRTAYCLNVQLCVKPEVREEFLKVINTNEMGSNNDEGLCLQYVYGECKDVPNKFIFHEEYKGADDGKQGFDAHTTAPHFLVWEEFAATDPFTKPPVVDFFRTLP
jgi:quinol monooxygenase YgiN